MMAKRSAAGNAQFSRGGRRIAGLSRAPARFDEFAARPRAKFAAADADKDGKVTADEHKAMHDKMRSSRHGRHCPMMDDGKAPPPPAE